MKISIFCLALNLVLAFFLVKHFQQVRIGGEAGLGIANTLSRFQPKPKDQGLIQARRATLLAWCSVDAAQWEPMPRVGEALKLAVDQDQGRHTLAAIGAQDALKRFEESRKKKQAVPTKKALKDLLGFFDVLAKP